MNEKCAVKCFASTSAGYTYKSAKSQKKTTHVTMKPPSEVGSHNEIPVGSHNEVPVGSHNETPVGHHKTMSSSLASKTVLITGASSGLGAHFAHTVSNAGANRVVLAARRTDLLKALASSLSSKHVQVVEMDVSDVDSIKRGFESITGEVHIVVNNAGVSMGKSEFLRNSWRG